MNFACCLHGEDDKKLKKGKERKKESSSSLHKAFRETEVLV